MNKVLTGIMVLVVFCAVQERCAAEERGRVPLDLTLAKVQKQSLLKEKALIDTKLQKVCRQRIELERKKRAVEEERLMYLLSRRLCADKQPAAKKPEVYPLPKPTDTGDRLDKELDSLLDKQNKLMERGLLLENELKEATEK